MGTWHIYLACLWLDLIMKKNLKEKRTVKYRLSVEIIKAQEY